MVRQIKARTPEDILLFAYGLLGTMPIVEIFGFTAFTWLSLFLFVYICAKKLRTIRVSRISKTFLVISAFAILSSLLAQFRDTAGYWKSMARNNIIWQIVYILIVVAYTGGNGTKKNLFYLKGIYYGAIVHAVWGLLQLVIFRLFGVSINRVIFYGLLGIENAEYVQTRGDSIAITGLCWNAGNLAALLIIGYMLSESLILKLFFLGIAALSGSRTLVLGMAVVLFLSFFYWAWRRYRQITVKRKKILVVILAGFGIIAVGIASRRQISNLVERVQYMLNTFSSGFMSSQPSSIIHARYWLSIPTVTKWNSLTANLFGYGIACSGYPFAMIFNQFNDHAWTVECDFINNLWSTGYIGFLLWYISYGKRVFRGKRIDKRYFIMFAAILVEGVTYNVTFNWCYIFLIFTFAQIDNKHNIFERESYAD